MLTAAVGLLAAAAPAAAQPEQADRTGGAPVTAEDFGFGRDAATGERPLLTILGRYSDLDFTPPHTTAYFTNLLFATERAIVGSAAGRGSVFDEMSGGEFYYVNAGVLGPFTQADAPATPVDESTYNCAYGTAEGCEAYRGGGNQIRNNVIRAAASAGFDFRAYDRDGDGCVRQDELTILLFFAEPAAGVFGPAEGARRGASADGGPRIVSVGDGLQVCSRVVGSGEAVSAATVSHELAHTLGLVDAYGNTGNNFLHTLMGPTITNPEDDLWEVHLDPYNKLRLGWIRPRILTVDDRGCYQLRAAETVGGTLPEAYLVYDPERGTREYFLLKHRLPLELNYDGDPFFARPGLALPDQGLGIWYVKTATNGVPLIVPNILGGVGNDRALYVIPPGGSPGNPVGGLGLWDPGDGAARPLWLSLDGTTRGTPSGLVVRVKSPVRQARITIQVGDADLGCVEARRARPPRGSLATPDDPPCSAVGRDVVCRLRRPGLVAVRRIPLAVRPDASFTVSWTVTRLENGPEDVLVRDALPAGFKGTGRLRFDGLPVERAVTRIYRARTGARLGRFPFDGVVEWSGAARRPLEGRLRLRSVVLVFAFGALGVHEPRLDEGPVVEPPRPRPLRLQLRRLPRSPTSSSSPSRRTARW